MHYKFEVQYLEEAVKFLNSLDEKSKAKVLYNIDKARVLNDANLFKKLDDNIWEFRTISNNQKIRLFAFWDKRKTERTLVIATHGIIKKKSKVDDKEIDKANKLRDQYLGKT